MYWACFKNNPNGNGNMYAAIIYSADDPQETNPDWDETYAYETEDEANAALDAD